MVSVSIVVEMKVMLHGYMSVIFYLVADIFEEKVKKKHTLLESYVENEKRGYTPYSEHKHSFIAQATTTAKCCFKGCTSTGKIVRRGDIYQNFIHSSSSSTT